MDKPDNRIKLYRAEKGSPWPEDIAKHYEATEGRKVNLIQGYGVRKRKKDGGK